MAMTAGSIFPHVDSLRTAPRAFPGSSSWLPGLFHCNVRYSRRAGP